MIITADQIIDDIVRYELAQGTPGRDGLDQGERHPVERFAAEYRALVAGGYTRRKMAERFGLTLHALRDRVYRARKAGYLERPRRAPRKVRSRVRQLKPCGTNGAYARHLLRREPIDDACRAAHRADSVQRKRCSRARQNRRVAA